jgi:hypothetical protein
MKNPSGNKRNKALATGKPESGDSLSCSRREFIESMKLIGGSIALVSLSEPASAAMKEATESAKAPVVKIPHVSIRMRCPNSFLFGITSREEIEITFAEVLKFHGYCAGGAAFAFRMAQEAFVALYGDRLAQRQQIKVHTSHHCCQAGALAYITGARTNFGGYGSHGDLVLIPEEEEKRIVFIDKPSGKSVVIKPHFNPHDTFAPLFQKTRKDPSFAPQVHEALNNKIKEYLTAPVEKLFSIETSKS